MWVSYCTCNIIRDVNLWFSKCEWNVNLFCDNDVIIRKKWQKDLHFWSTHFFKNIVLQSISRNILQTPPADDTLAGNFTRSNSIILVEDLIRWKGGFELFFDWPLSGWYWKQNYCWYVIKKNTCISVTDILLHGSVHKGCYIYNS